MLSIRAVELRDAPVLAQLHLKHLRSNLRGYPAQRLLAMHYQCISANQGACGYIAEQNGIVVGYVCGVWDKRLLRSSLLRQFWHRVLLWGLAEVLVNPYAISKSLYSLLFRNKRALGPEWPFELRPIVVDQQARGTGAAKALVDALIMHAKADGFNTIDLMTETDNIGAQRFYEKVGFNREADTVVSAESYLHYNLGKIE